MFFCHTPQQIHSDKIASPAEHSLAEPEGLSQHQQGEQCLIISGAFQPGCLGP